MLWVDVVEYAGVALELWKEQQRVALAVATNPHLEGKHQAKLWRQLGSETDRTGEARERLMRMEKQKGVKQNGV